MNDNKTNDLPKSDYDAVVNEVVDYDKIMADMPAIEGISYSIKDANELSGLDVSEDVWDVFPKFFSAIDCKDGDLIFLVTKMDNYNDIEKGEARELKNEVEAILKAKYEHTSFQMVTSSGDQYIVKYEKAVENLVKGYKAVHPEKFGVQGFASAEEVFDGKIKNEDEVMSPKIKSKSQRPNF